MQEIQILLVQTQTVAAQLAFQVVLTFGLALAWLVAMLGHHECASVWRGLFALVARLALALGVIWLAILAVAWPPLLERTGNVLGPIVAGLMAIMLVSEAFQQVLARSNRHALRLAAGILTAVGFTVALAIALSAMAWLREPSGVVLIDGRYQVTAWADMLDAPRLFERVVATVFGALVLLAAVVQWARKREPDTMLSLPQAWQQTLLGLGVLGLLGLLWLLTRSVGVQLNPVTQTTQTFYEALLTGSGNLILRVTFVLWVITLAGLVLGLANSLPLNRLAVALIRLPMFGAPVLWALMCWQLFFSPELAEFAGLPAADLASMQPPVALAFGLCLLGLLIGFSVWLVWRFLDRLNRLATANRFVGGN